MTETTGPSPFGVKLLAARTARGWTIRDLAERAGVTSGFITQQEKGSRPSVRRDLVIKVAQAFREPVTEWLDAAGYEVDATPSDENEFLWALDRDPNLTRQQKETLRSIYVELTWSRKARTSARRSGR